MFVLSPEGLSMRPLAYKHFSAESAWKALYCLKGHLTRVFILSHEKGRIEGGRDVSSLVVKGSTRSWKAFPQVS